MVKNPMMHDSSVYTRIPEEKLRMDWIVKHMTGYTLEVGCANGDIIGAYGEGEGMDVDEDRIGIARKRFPSIGFHCDDIRFGFPDGQYDTIAFPEVLEHMPMWDAQKVLKEAYRLAKKRIIITIDANRPIENVFLGHVWATTEREMNVLLSVIRGKITRTMVGKSWAVVIDK